MDPDYEKSDKLIHPADYTGEPPVPPWETIKALLDPEKRKNLKKAFPPPPGHSEVCVRLHKDGTFTYEPLDYKAELERKSGYYKQGDV